MKRAMIAATLVLATALAEPASANWSVGTNLGLSVVTEEGSDNLVLISVPSGAQLIYPTVQPGLRISSVDESGGTEFFVDAALASFHAGGGATSFAATLNLLHPFSRSAEVTQYVTVGGGVMHVGFSEGGANNPIIGGGLGVRGRVPHGHGTLRAELRADYVPGSQDGFPRMIVYGMKFGFDLWMR